MFGFPKIERTNSKAYKHNFLRSVIFQFKFKSNNEVVLQKELLKELFISVLPRYSERKEQGVELKFSGNNQTPMVQSIPSDNLGFEFKSNDGKSVLVCLTDSITYTVSGDIYKDFRSQHEILEKILHFLKSCNADVLEKVAIRKVNLVEYEMVENTSEEPFDILSNLINQNILSNKSYFPSSNSVAQHMYNTSYSVTNYYLNLIYGLIVSKTEKGKGQVVLDIDVIRNFNIELDLVQDELNKINDEVFNIFNWAISENAKEMLKS